MVRSEQQRVGSRGRHADDDHHHNDDDHHDNRATVGHHVAATYHDYHDYDASSIPAGISSGSDYDQTPSAPAARSTAA